MIKSIITCGALLAALAVSVPAWQDEAEPNPIFQKLVGLEGEWVMVGEDGQPTDEVVSQMRVTAAGSVVLEVLFPGQPHEMVTVYHMDGDDVVLTHYCALGNQPRMKAEAMGDDEVAFACMGGTNMASEDDNHMHAGLVRWVDENHIQTTWRGFENGENIHTVEFDLVRRL